VIETERLSLIPWPAAALDLESLGRELGIAVPEGWRPDVTDILPAQPPPYGPYAVLCGSELVGSGGFVGPPDASGTVEIGYETAPAHRRLGYASEVAAALVAWALDQPEVSRVIASPSTDNVASIRVLEHAGLRRAGTRGDALLYELRA
jgi:RimJ/RimL family protein N-acetyltransferase